MKRVIFVMNSRFKLVRKYFGINQEQFAKKINMSRSAYATLEIGQTTVRDRHISLLCSNCNVNEIWLRTGNGSMFNLDRNLNAALGEELAQIFIHQDDVMKRLLINIASLNEEELNIINDLVSYFLKKK